MEPTRRKISHGTGALALTPAASNRLVAAVEPHPEPWPHGRLELITGLPEVDRACSLAVRTLILKVSEKWGTICPVAAPAWSSITPPGSFHEYWTWEKYTGKTVASGCEEYSETTCGFLDGVVHGYFGVSRSEPGWKSLRLSPQPGNVDRCSFLLLPRGVLAAAFQKSAGSWRVELRSKVRRSVEVRLPDGRTRTVSVQDDAITAV